MEMAASNRPAPAPRSPRHRPVEPNPPRPRWVGEVAVASVEGDALAAGDHQLRDALAARHRERPVAEVHQQHSDLAAVVAVDGPRAVQHGDAVAQRQARARAHLRLQAGRQLQDEAGRDQRALAGPQHHRRLHRGHQIEARRAGRLVGREGEPRRVRQP